MRVTKFQKSFFHMLISYDMKQYSISNINTKLELNISNVGSLHSTKSPQWRKCWPG